MLTNLKIYIYTASGWVISAAQAESALRIISLVVTIALTIAVYLRDTARAKKQSNLDKENKNEKV